MMNSRIIVGLVVILVALVFLPVFLVSSGVPMSQFLKTSVMVDVGGLEEVDEAAVIDIGASQELIDDGEAVSFGVCSDDRGCPAGYVCSQETYKCHSE